MAKSNTFKKTKKLLNDPSLFFYDLFRKRIESRARLDHPSRVKEEQVILDIEELSAPEGISRFLVDAFSLPLLNDDRGVKKLLIFSGYLRGAVECLFNIKRATNAHLDIYTLGGAVSESYSESSDNPAACLRAIRLRTDFVAELRSENFQEVIQFYIYDVVDAIAILRSNNAWLKKVPAALLHEAVRHNCPETARPIDVVYTWVDQADEGWQKLWNQTFPETPYDSDRFTNNDELKYSLRSLHKYAPWVNRIHIVSNCQKPSWLKEHDYINWVDHTEVFSDASALPTFSSHSIECCLHRIPGLTENFIYFNDDFVLNQPCTPTDFFDVTGRSISYFEPYGMVSDLDEGMPQHDYILAAKNGRKLMLGVMDGYQARQLHRHVPYALKKSVICEMESRFSDAFERTRKAKLRSPEDISLTSFLYHHYAYATGKAVKGDAGSLIVRPNNIEKLLSRELHKYKFLCFNDGGGSSVDKVYKIYTHRFYQLRLAFQAPWESVTLRGSV